MYPANKNSDQPAHLRSLIRIFVFRMKKPCIIGYPKCAQWRFRSYAQSDLNLRWVHIEDKSSEVATHTLILESLPFLERFEISKRHCWHDTLFWIVLVVTSIISCHSDKIYRSCQHILRCWNCKRSILRKLLNQLIFYFCSIIESRNEEKGVFGAYRNGIWSRSVSYNRSEDTQRMPQLRSTIFPRHPRPLHPHPFPLSK